MPRLQALSGGVCSAAAVDEGRFRANWFLTDDAPSTTVTDSTTYTPLTLNDLPFWVLDKTLFFTNNLPYSETLEYGLYRGVGESGKTVSYGGGIYSTQYVGGSVRYTIHGMQQALRNL